MMKNKLPKSTNSLSTKSDCTRHKNASFKFSVDPVTTRRKAQKPSFASPSTYQKGVNKEHTKQMSLTIQNSAKSICSLLHLFMH